MGRILITARAWKSIKKKLKKYWIRCQRLPAFTFDRPHQWPIVKPDNWLKSGVPLKQQGTRNMAKSCGKGTVTEFFVKSNVQEKMMLFLVKCKAHASMKSILYEIHIFLGQRIADAVYEKCSCKPGQGSCCKHVANILCTIHLLDIRGLVFAMESGHELVGKLFYKHYVYYRGCEYEVKLTELNNS